MSMVINNTGIRKTCLSDNDEHHYSNNIFSINKFYVTMSCSQNRNNNKGIITNKNLMLF